MLKKMAEASKLISNELAQLTTKEKNKVLKACAICLREDAEKIISANLVDLKVAKEKNMSQGLLDRLALDDDRIDAMAKGLEDIAELKDPVGQVLSMEKLENGLLVGRKRVPLGVVAIIYEARPNVTADAFGLCFKSGNAVILRGGSDAIKSNEAIVNSIHRGLRQCGISTDALALITDTSRESAMQLMTMNGYIDVLIPRGGAGLIKSVVENSTVAVIETGTGNCHIYVDYNGDTSMATEIIVNSKTQRIGVCNACESILIHKDIAKKALPVIADALLKRQVQLRCDDKTIEILEQSSVTKGIDSAQIKKATPDDWGREYLDLIVSIKIVNSVEDAIAHINKYNTGHSEAIITNDYSNSQKFLDQVDAAAVYVNASTRFTDGSQFGLGGEIGISTQKLHARGPMGLEALTTTKYIIYGQGQIRN